MKNYLELCQIVTPYLVATIGVLGAVLLIGVLLWVITGVWYIALVEISKRFNATWLNTKFYAEFRAYRKQIQKEAKP